MPNNRREAVDEIMRSGFTIPAVLAVGLLWPLPGEIGEIARMHERMNIEDYLEEALTVYVKGWGRTLPHRYWPNYEAMGDCVECGNITEADVHQHGNFYMWLASHKDDPPPSHKSSAKLAA